MLYDIFFSFSTSLCFNLNFYYIYNVVNLLKYLMSFIIIIYFIAIQLVIGSDFRVVMVLELELIISFSKVLRTCNLIVDF